MTVNYGNILKRAFQVTKNNRSLWLFGFLLALFGGSSFPYYSGNIGDWQGFKTPNAPKIDAIFIVIIIIAALALALIAIFLTFLARGALIDMVKDLIEEKTVSIKSGLKGGFTFIFPLLAISLLIGIPFFLAVILISAILLGPGILLLVAKQTVIGVILLIIGGLVWLAAIIAGAVAVTIITLYANRYLIIEDTGIIEAIKQGYHLLRHNLGDFIILWLINVGLGIAYGIAALIIIFILGLPIVLLAIATTLWLLVFLIIPAGALIFFRGLVEVFFSTYWTLAFKELNTYCVLRSAYCVFPLP